MVPRCGFSGTGSLVLVRLVALLLFLVKLGRVFQRRAWSGMWPFPSRAKHIQKHSTLDPLRSERVLPGWCLLLGRSIHLQLDGTEPHSKLERPCSSFWGPQSIQAVPTKMFARSPGGFRVSRFDQVFNMVDLLLQVQKSLALRCPKAPGKYLLRFGETGVGASRFQ